MILTIYVQEKGLTLAKLYSDRQILHSSWNGKCSYKQTNVILLVNKSQHIYLQRHFSRKRKSMEDMSSVIYVYRPRLWPALDNAP